MSGSFVTQVELEIEASKKTGAISATAQEVQGFKGTIEEAAQAAKDGGEGFDKLSISSETLSKALGHLVTAAAVGQFFKEAVEESLKEEEALRVLRGSIESTGASWEKYKGQIEAYAAAQEAATRFDDTVTFEVLGKLALATQSVQEAMAATTLAQDLAVQSGKPLAQTTALVNDLLLGQERAVVTATKEFGNYAGGATTAQDAIDNLRRSVGGAAAAEESHTKAIEQARAALSNFAQDIGDFIAPAIALLAKATEAAAVGFRMAFALMTKDFAKFEELAKAATQANEKLGEAAVLRARQSTQAAEEEARKKGELQQKLEEEAERATNDEFDLRRIRLEEELQAARDAGVEKLSIVMGGVQQEIDLASYKTMRELEIAQDQAAQLYEVDRKTLEQKKQLEKEQQKIEATRRANFQSTLEFIATLSTAKNRELALIGKASGLANAYINTGVAVTRALSAAPPPFNFALAAAVGAAGAAQIATIAGVQLKEGGVTTGATDEGIFAQIGERRRKEGILPLEDGRAMQMVGKAIADAGGLGGGGGGNTFNLYLVMPGLEAIRDPKLAQELLQILGEAMASPMPEARVAAVRIVDLATLNDRRSA